ncbi:MAG: YebC/PmpR family DNA-binding transcriptional regulator [Eubacterium aggregans]|uniref:Probable transcriptional regulatory protein SAMN04515656_10655 n=1 Tax=Eubacterium aggregans TaxID=81409 RepID=A0A1H3ZMF5_9FIRM|nr:YebC/PmpR family DNA-binding transcriptional regulator [Eubacterium aggregans]MDD4691089.1 YebC/PmpR family DNA-binding transcriptional regulator [Eubacterium aggregans]MEA5074336.1 YebC/PmpR family DNA-binding transcriptional regulator [Eubacterium aggregans]SEA24959.1 DNA-binding regulatory protein, YebC/PmpR family [Eubacterium aggregans]
MSGHSKWSNIKNRKGKQDAVKGKIFTKMAKLIAVAAREGGGDPEMNAKLRDAIAKAKAANMPNDNVDRAVKKGTGELGDAIFEEITYEGYGPGGVAVIVSALTDNKNRTAADVRHAFDKNGGNLGTNGCVGFLFTKSGRIMVEKSDAIDEDELMMLALDAGAEDMEVAEDGYTIITAPEDFAAVMDAMGENDIEVLTGEVAMIPSTETALSPEDVKKMEKMLDMFDDNDDVQEVWHNWNEGDE